jgi:H/ACA ribonucleoprotein complex subunit 2
MVGPAAAKAKAIRRGVKEVVKAVRKGEKGFVLIAGDISPIDVIAHLPILCEDMVRDRVPFAISFPRATDSLL